MRASSPYPSPSLLPPLAAASMPGARRLSIRHLRAFVAVAQYGSLTQAARFLSVTQSALSLTIQHTEEDLGLRLFDRSTRRLHLTDAGKTFHPLASRLLDQFDKSVQDMRALSDRKTGRLGIAAVPSVLTLLLSEATTVYIERYPGVDLYLREENAEGVYQRLLNGEVELGIAGAWDPADAQGELTFEPLFEDEYGVVMAPDHPLAAERGRLAWDAIRSYRLIGFSDDLGMQHQLSNTPGLCEQVREPRYKVSNTAAIASLVASGAGISVMSALAAQRAPLDALAFRLLRKPALSRRVGVWCLRGKSLSPAAEAMLSLIRACAPGLARFPGVHVLPAQTA